MRFMLPNVGVMDTHLLEARHPGPTPAPVRPPRISFRTVGHDLTYVVTGFALSVASFILLVTLCALGVSTLVIWIGAPVLAVLLVTATGFARENRELLRRWGSPVAEPTYHGRPRRRLLSMLADPQAWVEVLHGTVVAFPLRTATFAVTVTWLAGAAGGLTWFAWGHFLPEGEYGGLAWLLVSLTGLAEPVNWFLLEAIAMFVAGLVLLCTAPAVVRSCAAVDAVIAKALIGGWATGTAPGADR